MTDGKKKEMLVRESTTMPCCGCKGRVTFEAPRPDRGPTFFHTMPYCARFDRTNTTEDVLQYLRDCINAQKN